MGECQGWLFEPTFNKSVKLRQVDSRITSSAGALLLREADHRLGLTAHIASDLQDNRRQDLIRYDQIELLRQSLYGYALGYSCQDDADCFAHDTAMRLATWHTCGTESADERLASQPSASRMIHRFSSRHNRNVLRNGLSQTIGRHQTVTAGMKVRNGTIDIDPSPIETHGHQDGTAYNGYYRKKIYYPLVAGFSSNGDFDSNRLGDGFVHAALRPGNSAGTTGCCEFAVEAIDKCRDLAKHLEVRLDAGLVSGEVLDAIDDQKVHFTARIKTNAVLDRKAAPYLKRDIGRPAKDGDQFVFELGDYQAENWSRAYRVVLVVVDMPDPVTGLRPLFPRYFFLITNWKNTSRSAWQLLEHYRKRGTYEDRYGEFNSVIGPNLSAESFRANEVILLLKLLAFNLVSVLRGEMEKASSNGWDAGRLQKTVLRTGGIIVRKSRRLLIDIAKANGALWQKLLCRIRRWKHWHDIEEYPMPRAKQWMLPPQHAHLCLVLCE